MKEDKENKTIKLQVYITPTQLELLEKKYIETIQSGNLISLPDFLRLLIEKGCQ